MRCIVAAMSERAAALERLRTGRFDLLVVGGGIIGAGVAEVASRHGFSVALVERDDFASGTSSASSKLIHGGLRYLRLGHFSLVREALAEVHALSRYRRPPSRPAAAVPAPGLPRRAVRARSDPRRALVVRGSDGRRLRARTHDRAGGCGRRSSRRCGSTAFAPPASIPDAQTDDARLCLANLRGAADAGAAVVNRIELAGLERGPVAQLRDTLTGETFEVGARVVVNAAGPWIDDVRRLEDPRAGTSVTLSRGAHLVLERDGGWGAAVTIPIDRTRVAFAVPWAGRLLVGTTDTAFEGDARTIAPTEAEERQILEEAALALDVDALGPVRARFAGVRVLPAGAVATAQAHRETMLSSGPLGMVSVAGGKLTTYRRIALAVLHQLRAELELHRIDRRPAAAAGRRGSRRRGRRPPAAASGAGRAARRAPGAGRTARWRRR